MIICNDCGTGYDDNCQSCPSCGLPKEYSVNLTGLSHCPNCGAPITNSIRCDYCRSTLPKAPIPVQPMMPPPPQEDNSLSGIAAALVGGIIGGILSS